MYMLQHFSILFFFILFIYFFFLFGRGKGVVGLQWSLFCRAPLMKYNHLH